MNIYFVSKLPKVAANVIDLSGEHQNTPEGVCLISLNCYFIEYEDIWKRSFIDSLGEINKCHAGLHWWAYTTSAKNFLSSNLGREVFQTLAICEFLGKDVSDLPLFILGASRGQKEFLGPKIGSFLDSLYAGSKGIVRNVYHALKSILLSGKMPLKGHAEVLFFSYFLNSYQQDKDPFFGSLIKKVTQEKNIPPIVSLYINGGFNNGIALCENEGSIGLLFSNLKLVDIFKSLYCTVVVSLKRSCPIQDFVVSDMDFLPLLRDQLRHDINSGRYFLNMLTYKAVKRLVKKTSIKNIIYPYENKSLEKMLLIAAREVNSTVYCTGYQHSSVTARHTTLLFSKGESAVTPLPDRIVTLGEVTRHYLESNGNYPEGIFRTGCALRQSFPSFIPVARRGCEKLHILLPLSSSKLELLEAVMFCKKVNDLMFNISFGIRPHPEFPLDSLPCSDKKWVEEHAENFSSSSLESNILWADICVYVSSTVAIEAMLYGVPIINLRLGDVIDPDPVLGSVCGVWKVFTPEELVTTLQEWKGLTELQKNTILKDLKRYAQSYLIAPNDDLISLFIDEKC